MEIIRCLVEHGANVNSNSENGGIVRFFDIDERMDDNVLLHKAYTGFTKPVDIVYRERM